MSGDDVPRWDVPNSPPVSTHPYSVSVPVVEDFDGVPDGVHAAHADRWSAVLDQVGALVERVRVLTDGEEDHADLFRELDDVYGCALALYEDRGARRAGEVVASVLGLKLA